MPAQPRPAQKPPAPTRRHHLSLPRPLIPLTRPTRRARLAGKTDSVLIIGAGLSGLSAALRLLAAGKRVTIIEAHDHVGGRCATETLRSDHGEFDADTGATVLTMPSLIDAAISSVGIDPRSIVLPGGRRWSASRVTPTYLGTFASERYLRIFSDQDRMRAELRRFACEKYACAPEDARVQRLIWGYDQHRCWAQNLFSLSYEDFLAADFDSPLDVCATPASATALGRLLASGAQGRLGRAVRKFFQDREVEKMFSFQSLYAGQAPDEALAIYAAITHMDSTMGVFYPEYSIGDAAEAMACAVRQAGGEILLGTQVVGMEREDTASGTRRVTGVRCVSGAQRSTSAPHKNNTNSETHTHTRTNASADLGTQPNTQPQHAQPYITQEKTTPSTQAQTHTLRADAIISTVDLPIIAGWLGEEDSLRHIRYSPSAVVIHATIPTNITAQWTNLPHGQAHHTLSFGEAWESVFDNITAPAPQARLMEDPCLLITRPAVSRPARIRSMNGVQYEPISILAPTPNLHSAPIDWEQITDRYVQELLSELEQRGYRGIAEHIRIARVDTPHSYAHEHGYAAGSPFSAAHTLRQTGPFRTRNFPAFGYENVVLAGCGTTPGVGIPTVLLSGALAARRITGGGVR